MKRLGLCAALYVMACGGASATTTAKPADALTDAEFSRRLDEIYWAHFEFRPQAAVRLGYHQYDGRVPDRSPDAIASEIERLRAARAWLEAIEPATLSEANQLDREIMLAETRRELFHLDVLHRPTTDPLWYLLFSFGLDVYTDRPYAPIDQRARAVLSACRGAPRYYEQMRSNLSPKLGRPLLQVGVMFIAGAVDLVDKVVRKEMSAVGDATLRGDIDQCLDEMVAGLHELERDLGSRMPAATDDFALGEARFLSMLADTQGMVTDVDTLERIGRDDLARNTKAIEDAAREIDPKRPAGDVIAEVSQDKPAVDGLLALANEQIASMRAFIVEHEIATPLGDDAAEARLSPPHLRGNMAMLNSAGPFETARLPSYYYISPPNSAWPEVEQRAYLPSRWDLLFLTVHEVWPGHFLQGRYIDRYGSRLGKSFETYSTSEGWAHYAEEMMWDAGVGGHDPRAHIGQLKNALLRNVRFLVSIGIHTRGMTVDQAIELFRVKAFADPNTARQQALRGTGDPMYLSYTLGKIAIRKLAADWRAAHPKASLGAFHDAFLRYGEAPLPVIRRAMLGDNAGPLF